MFNEWMPIILNQTDGCSKKLVTQNETVYDVKNNLLGIYRMHILVHHHKTHLIVPSADSVSRVSVSGVVVDLTEYLWKKRKTSDKNYVNIQEVTND